MFSEAYVLTYNGAYVRFSSYLKGTLVSNILAATLYNRLIDAEKRWKKDCYINDEPVGECGFKIMLVGLTLTQKLEVNISGNVRTSEGSGHQG